jgi:hypothetical protein
VTDNEPGPGFEVEAATVEEFLQLLREREEVGSDPVGTRGALREAVFVAGVRETRGSRYGFPKVIRYAIAAFAYGRGVACHRRLTSSAVELPEVTRTLEERQQEACDELRAEVKRGLEEASLRVPLCEGSLPNLQDRSRSGRDEDS